MASINELANYDGDTNVNATPPDAALATDENYHVGATNDDVVIIDRSSQSVTSRTNLAEWFDDSAYLQPNDVTNVFDPRAIYDLRSNHFILIATVRESGNDKGYLVASASDTGDPTGSWNCMTIDTTNSGEWVDFPGLGLDANHFYVTGNVFDFGGGGHQRSQLVTVDKSDLYSSDGANCTLVDDLRAENGNTARRPQPCHNYDSDDTAYLIHAYKEGGNVVTVFEIANPLSSPSVTTHSVDINDYNEPPDDEGGQGAEQPDTSRELEINGSELVDRGLIMDNELWFVHGTGYRWGDSDLESVISWYEIGLSNYSVFEQGGFGGNDGYWWHPSIEGDPTDDTVVMVYQRSSATNDLYPTIAVAGKNINDNAGVVGENHIIEIGESAYVEDTGQNLQQYGDYVAIASDPSAGKTFALYGQYPVDSSTNGEQAMRIANFEYK